MTATRILRSPLVITFIVLYFVQTAFRNLHGKTSDVSLRKSVAQETTRSVYESATDYKVTVHIGRLFKFNLKKSGFYKSRFSIFIWTKHGRTVLLVAGHDPPVNITIYMDVILNPGQDFCVKSQNLNFESTLRVPSPVIVKTYLRTKLLKFRCVFKRSSTFPF